MSNLEEPSPNQNAIEESVVPVPTVRYKWRDTLRGLLVCNPFFLCSAALLLYAINRLSVDPDFLSDETQNLLFNFSALQFYEVLVICTAILLCRRKVWYDSALLVVLENGLVLIPFILITQANLIGSQLAWILTLCGAVAVGGRLFAVRRWYANFNLPNRALLMGLLILIANVALPRVFRSIVEFDYEGWRTPNLIIWHIVLPLLAAGANLLPRPREHRRLNPERSWLPLFIYGLWMAGTAVHAWCAAYIGKISFDIYWLGPLGWVCAWTVCNRLKDCVAVPSPGLQRTMLVIAFATPLLAVAQPALYVTLCGLNALAYIVLWRLGPLSLRRACGELAVASAPFIFAAFPLQWENDWPLKLTRTEHVLCAAVTYFLLLAMRSRRPEIGILGALAVATGTGWLAREWSLHAAAQGSLVFLLIHSLHWPKADYPNAQGFRRIAAILWVGDSFAWTRGAGLAPCAFVATGAFLTLSAWGFMWRRHGTRELFLPGASLLALVSGPGNWFQQNSPAGVVALAGSFALFILGAIAAWTRHTWEPKPGVEPPAANPSS
jgi:hypothetical protein